MVPEIKSYNKNVRNSPKEVRSRAASPGPAVAGSEDEVAISLQPLPSQSSVTEIYLQLCDKLSYEARNGIPGLKYHKDDDEGWAPVKRWRCGQRSQYKATEDESENNSQSEVDVKWVSSIQVCTSSEGPVLRVQGKRTTHWIPVKPATPITTRSRARNKH